MRPGLCDQSVDLNPRPRGERSRFAVVAILYLIAQLLVAAHDPTFAGDFIDHVPNECAACLAGAATDDPSAHGPALTPVSFTLVSAATAMPAALYTASVIRAASPRAPPSI